MTESVISHGWGKDVRFRRVPGETSTIKNEEGETTGAGRFVSSSLTTNQLKMKDMKTLKTFISFIVCAIISAAISMAVALFLEAQYECRELCACVYVFGTLALMLALNKFD